MSEILSSSAMAYSRNYALDIPGRSRSWNETSTKSLQRNFNAARPSYSMGSSSPACATASKDACSAPEPIPTSRIREPNITAITTSKVILSPLSFRQGRWMHKRRRSATHLCLCCSSGTAPLSNISYSPIPDRLCSEIKANRTKVISCWDSSLEIETFHEMSDVSLKSSINFYFFYLSYSRQLLRNRPSLQAGPNKPIRPTGK